MQALVRVQARVRARRVRMALESQLGHQKAQEQESDESHVREIEVSCQNTTDDYNPDKTNCISSFSCIVTN